MNRPLFSHDPVLLSDAGNSDADPPSKAQDDISEQVQVNGENGSKKLTISTRPVMVMSDGSVVARAGTMLVRTRDNVFATLDTSGLTPGTVVTARFGRFRTRPVWPKQTRERK